MSDGSNNTPSAADLLAQMHHTVMAMHRAWHSRGHAGHTQSRILGILSEHSPLEQRTLLEHLGMRPASLSELLRKLEDNGFIVKERDEADRRNFNISLTGKGREAATQIRGRHGGGLEREAEAIFADFSPEERAQFMGLLEKLDTSLQSRLGADDGERGNRHRHGHFGSLRRRGGHGGGRHGDGRSRPSED